MATPVSLMDDQMVDMAFITQLTGLTDKWFAEVMVFRGQVSLLCVCFLFRSEGDCVDSGFCLRAFTPER